MSVCYTHLFCVCVLEQKIWGKNLKHGNLKSIEINSVLLNGIYILLGKLTGIDSGKIYMWDNVLFYISNHFTFYIQQRLENILLRKGKWLKREKSFQHFKIPGQYH